MFDNREISLLTRELDRLGIAFSSLPPVRNSCDYDDIIPVLDELAVRLTDNYPYFHPLYIGQMLKPPHPVARIAWALSMYINPNNHALDGGRATSALEKEAVSELATMLEWKTHLGHLTSGGTFANLEALWIARKIHPDRKILFSEMAHYTHERMCGVLGMEFLKVPCDSRGRMNADCLENYFSEGGTGTVVVTMGTTACGAIDPLSHILRLRERYDFRIHADAAYGGYFRVCSNLAPETRDDINALREADSVVIGPHKHGLQPYGCGCVLFKDPDVGHYYRHDSPYTYFSSTELHLGEISLECSRPGAAAAALWTTQKYLPLKKGGVFDASLSEGRNAALALFEWLRNDSRTTPVMEPQLDIVLWIMNSDRASHSSLLSQKIFEKAAEKDLHLALTRIPVKMLKKNRKFSNEFWDVEEILCIRVCLMKPEHHEWISTIIKKLDESFCIC